MKKRISNKMFYSILFIILINISISSQSKYIYGKVLDAFDNPLSDVKVQVENSGFIATTNSNGEYKLDYAPGEFNVVFTKPNFTSSSIKLNISAKSDYPLADVTLYEIPTKQSIYLLEDNSYRELFQYSIEVYQKKTGNFFNGKVVKYYKINGDPIPINSTTVNFIDNDGKSQYLFKVSNDNIIFTSEYNTMGLLTKVNGNYYNGNDKQIGTNMYLRNFTLEEGKYAFMELVEDGLGNKVPSQICYFFELRSAKN